MKIREIIKKKIYEAVGVPANIDVAAEKIFNDIINTLGLVSSHFDYVGELEEKILKLKGPYTFSDHSISNIRLKVEFEKDDNLEILGMYVHNDTEIVPPKVKYEVSDTLTMGLRFQGPSKTEISELIDFMTSRKPKMVSSIAHEIMHDYDHAKKPIGDLENKIEYVTSKEGVGGTFELNLVIVGGYFMNQIENIVRPSEVYTELIQKGVTKEDFINQLNDTSYVEYLNLMRNLNYENLISALKKDYDDVIIILRSNNIAVYIDDVDKNIELFLYTVRVFLINTRLNVANNVIPRTFEDMLNLKLGIESEGLKFFRKYADKISKNGKYLESNFNYEESSEDNREYFTNRINKIVETSNKLYRKIAKIYSILPDKDNTQTLNKKISMKGNKNEEVFETNFWDNPKILFGKQYPTNLKNGIDESYNLEEKISLLESRIIDEKIEEGKSFVISEMKKIGIEKLPYSYSALKLFIDPKTMNIHYNKHYKGYVKKLNDALSKRKGGDVELEDIIKSISKYDDDIRNNAGGAFNHALFWNMLSPKKTEMSSELKKKIVDEFTSFAKFKQKFEEVAKGRFGSGWVWLVITKNKKLKVVSTPNQDNPLMNVVKEGGFPLLGLDLWEHSYYLKYQNKRDEYISNFWNVVNWDFVSKMYDMKTKTDLV
jgi:Fe-Mn family superoxide dismutase